MNVGNVCAVKGCVRRSTKRHMCDMHYQRLICNGSVNVVRKSTGSRVLDAAQCEQARKWSVGFVTPMEIARRLGVSDNTVRRVLKGNYSPKEADQ